MGRVIASLVENRQDCEITAGIDLRSMGTEAFPVFSSLSEVDREADVLIDFSNPSLLSSLLQYAREKKLPVVLCTTGYTPEQVQAVKDAAKEIPVFYSRNMSLGINLLIELAKKATAVLGRDFDIEIVEEHHNQKLDAPSGTALMIADAISETREGPSRYMYDRHSHPLHSGRHHCGRARSDLRGTARSHPPLPFRPVQRSVCCRCGERSFISSRPSGGTV